MRKKILVYGLLLLLLAAALYVVKSWYSSRHKPDIQRGQDIVIGERTLNEILGGMHFYYGSLHGHSRYSDGLLTSRQDLLWARHIGDYDFYALTDHAEDLSDEEWEDLGRQAEEFTEDGKFLAIRGFEWSAEVGHISVYKTVHYLSAEILPNLKDFYSWLEANHGIAQFNHPKPANFHDLTYVAHVETNICGIESGNKRFGNNDNKYLPFYQKALDQGWRVAPMYGQDNHFIPFYCNRTVVLASELTKEALFEAIQARRVYSSDDPNMRVVFKLGDFWMGSVVNIPEDSVQLTIFISDDEPITRIELLTKHGRCVQMKEFDASQVIWEPVVEIQEETFFYLRITEQDTLFDEVLHGEQITVTAPIWVTANEWALSFDADACHAFDKLFLQEKIDDQERND